MKNTSGAQTPREIEGASIATASTIADSSSNTIDGVPTTIEDRKKKD